MQNKELFYKEYANCKLGIVPESLLWDRSLLFFFKCEIKINK